jgi:hypothetical protein
LHSEEQRMERWLPRPAEMGLERYWSKFQNFSQIEGISSNDLSFNMMTNLMNYIVANV